MLTTHRPSLPRASLPVFLLLLQILPTLPIYLTVATSMALGTTLTAALFIFIYWTHAVIWNRLPPVDSIRFMGWPLTAFVLIVAFILLHAIVALRIQPSIDLDRMVQTLVPLAFLIVGGGTMGILLAQSSDREVERAADISFRFLCALIVMRLVGAEPDIGSLVKPMFPYVEVSHFVLAFSPILMFKAVRARSSRKMVWILFGLALGAVLQSVSLLACVLLIAYNARRFLVIACVGLVISALGLPFELDYFSSRLDFSAENRNLTTLVYIQGWEQILESLQWSLGWGLGFEELGFRQTESLASALIRGVTGGMDSNLRDGSFVLVKLVSEFGVFAMFMIVAFLLIVRRCARELRGGQLGAAATFIRCIIVSYVIDVFIRGPGYFSESSLLFVAAFSAWMLKLKAAPHPAGNTASPAIAGRGTA
jgi:hypothetical protein